MGTREDLDVQAVIEKKEKFVPFLFCRRRRHLTEVHEERKTAAAVIIILSTISRANKTIDKVG